MSVLLWRRRALCRLNRAVNHRYPAAVRVEIRLLSNCFTFLKIRHLLSVTGIYKYGVPATKKNICWASVICKFIVTYTSRIAGTCQGRKDIRDFTLSRANENFRSP
ncbi:hypothetical protein Tcan_01130, partial [Toxocara canis]